MTSKSTDLCSQLTAALGLHHAANANTNKVLEGDKKKSG